MPEETKNADLHLLQHPLLQHKLTLLRKADLSTRGFRNLTHEIGALIAYELMRDAKTEAVEVTTPLGVAQGVTLQGKNHVFVAILRAGLGVVDGMLTAVPTARVGHVGLYRDKKLKTAVEYYLKLPKDIAERKAVVVSSVLATGCSAVAAVDRVKESGAHDVRFACLLAAQEGIDRLQEAHPDVPIYTCAVDPRLDERGYVLPGLGDVGDRLYGTE